MLMAVLGMAVGSTVRTGWAQEITSSPMSPPQTSATAGFSESGDSPKWNVRVEVLMISMPQDKAIELMPELRDEGKIDDAVGQMLAAVKNKEAILTGYPVLTVQNGKRSATDSLAEKRFPTEFNPPETPKGGEMPWEMTANPNPETDFSEPTAFETREMGVSLEASPRVRPDGKWIQLDVLPKQVEWGDFDYYKGWRTASGGVSENYQPQFLTSKINTTVTVRNRRWTLLGVHKVSKPEDYLEVLVLMVTATPIE
jgi:hypothetical protein